MNTEREELRRLASEATPGPREDGKSCVWLHWTSPGGHEGVSALCRQVATEADATFIAAANPSVVLGLLDQLDAMEGALEAIDALHDNWLDAEDEESGERFEYCGECGVMRDADEHPTADLARAALSGGREK